MLVRLLRTHLPPYRRDITIVIVLQFVQTIATLYLPTLNADIIDKGVVTGDIGYIWRVGGLMILVTLAQVVTAGAAVYFGARAATGSSAWRICGGWASSDMRGSWASPCRRSASCCGSARRCRRR